MRSAVTSSLMAAGMALAGCAPSLPQMPPVLPGAPSEGAKCRVAASMSSPLVTEWPASEKANLEVLLRSGAVAVSYSGCSMKLLPECRVRGGYRWLRTTPARDVLEINNEDELYAKLPLGAASLEGELKRAGNLSVDTVVSGQIKLEGAVVTDVPAEGECARATHLITALSLGAFSLSAGGSVSGKASAGFASVEAGGGASRAAKLLRGAGDPAACGQSTDESPSANCASPVQVFLTPLPGRGADEGPPDMVKVELVSGNPAARWDVYSDDQVICTTPCSRWLHPARPLMLRSRDESFMRAPDRVEVPNLLQAANDRHIMVAAHPTAQGKLATGIVFTTFSGMGVAAGTALTAVGFAVDGHETMRTAGLITLAVSIPALVGSIYLITGAMPRAEVIPYRPYGQGSFALAKPRLTVGPGGISGTF